MIATDGSPDAAPGTTEEFAGLPGLRSVVAANPSPLTLDGTRTYLVGRARVAVIDPGPVIPEHLSALESALAGVEEAVILLTHGHPDHAGGAGELARRTGLVVRRLTDGSLAPGEPVETDAGALVPVPTPGHAPDHLAFSWPERKAVFCGDLLLGGETSTLVAPPEGNLSDYLASLERLRTLAPAILLPTHGPPFLDPGAALDAYVEHRRDRERAVLAAVRAGASDRDALLDAVYGPDLRSDLRGAAAAALPAYLTHLERQGRIAREGAGWRLRSGADEPRTD